MVNLAQKIESLEIIDRNDTDINKYTHWMECRTPNYLTEPIIKQY